MSHMSVTLRPIRAGDEPFLYDIYAGTRLEELAPLGWSAEQQKAFLVQQFGAQHQYYQANYAGANFQVILLDGRPVGRLYVARWNDQIRIIDIALLPEYRNAGIGSRLLGDLLDEAAQAGKPVRIHVEKFNPALRLYQRLGFAIIEDRGVYWFMERVPPVMHAIPLECGSYAPMARHHGCRTPQDVTRFFAYRSHWHAPGPICNLQSAITKGVHNV
jgi:ribosomal protein S18 acetylase RimI-like enzyme